MNNFEKEICEILKKHIDSFDGEALDGDEVDVLAEHLKNFINLNQGNITEKEYFELELAVKKTIKGYQEGAKIIDFIERNKIGS